MRLLRERGFLLLWVGQLLNLLATWAMRTMLLIWIYALTHSGVAVSLVGLAEALPLLLLSPISGVYVDRWNRAYAMAGSTLATALLILPLLTVNSHAGLPVIVLVAILANACGQLFYTAATSAVPVVVGVERAGEANSALSVLNGAVAVVAPGVAALMFSAIGPHRAAVVFSALFFLAAPAAALVPAPQANRSEVEGGSVLGEMMDGLQYVRHSSLLTALTGVGFIAFLGIGALTVLDVLFVSRALHLPSADVGVLYSSSGAGELLGGVIMAVLGSRLAGHYHQLLAWSIVINALAFIGYALSPSLWLAAGILFFVGLTFPPVIVSYMTMTQYVTEDAFMGRVNSVINAATGIAQILSVVSGGALADLFGVRQVIGTAAALWGVSGILTFVTIRSTPEPQSRDRPDAHPAAGGETISTVS